MSNICNTLAAKVLLSHLPEITDGTYKAAIETAIETLLIDAVDDWHESNCELPVIDYLGITKHQYAYWVLGIRAQAAQDTANDKKSEK